MNSIISLALLLTSIASINAQNNATAVRPPLNATTTAVVTPTVCSCSPTIITFVLSLNQTCDNNDIESNDGVDGSFCFTEVGVALPAPEVVDADNTTDATDGVVAVNATDVEPIRFLQDAADPVVEIVSVQFLEFDTGGDLTVINQDDSYADVSLADGDRLKFASASSFLDTSLPLEDQMASPALVPGGASLILYGKTASGVVVRNRFFFIYDMNCGRANEPVKVDDEIGWVTVAETSNAWPTFCPALPAGSPTIAPKSNEPTLSPSKSPTLNPSKSPMMSLSMSMTHAPTVAASLIPAGKGNVNGPAFGKASKTPKHLKSKVSKSDAKSGKGAKSSKSSKSKGSKGSVDGKSMKSSPDGAFVMGKVTGFDAERSNNGAASGMSSLYAGMSLLVASVLLSRQ